MTIMYEVATHDHCARMIDAGINNPAQGLLQAKHKWTRITPRPVGLARAKQLAEQQSFHAVVCVWGTAEQAYDNGRPARVPAGTWQPDARSVFDPKAATDEPVRATRGITGGFVVRPVDGSSQ